MYSNFRGQLHSASRERTKLYSSEQVSRLMRSIVQPKIQYFHQQIQQKQRIIRELNQRLNQNDIRLQQQRNQIEQLKCSQNYLSDKQLVQIINQVIEQKVGSYQYTLSRHLHNIKEASLGRIRQEEKQTIQKLNKLNQIVAESVSIYKKKSNSYWTSIKEALNKMHSRIIRIEQRVQGALQGINRSGSQSILSQSSTLAQQLHKSRLFLRKFGEFKKAVLKMENGYKELLGLSRKVKKYYLCDQTTPLEYSRQETMVKIEQPSTTHLINSNLSPIKQRPQSPPQHLHVPVTTTHHPNSNHSAWAKRRPQQASILTINSNNNNHNNSNLHASVALVNLSMESRREMSEEVRKRLIEMIQLKGIKPPILCYLDQINYLKNIDGNYIFDIKGNMFKMNPEVMARLCSEGILKLQQNLVNSRSRVKKLHS